MRAREKMDNAGGKSKAQWSAAGTTWDETRGVISSRVPVATGWSVPGEIIHAEMPQAQQMGAQGANQHQMEYANWTQRTVQPPAVQWGQASWSYPKTEGIVGRVTHINPNPGYLTDQQEETNRHVMMAPLHRAMTPTHWWQNQDHQKMHQQEIERERLQQRLTQIEQTMAFREPPNEYNWNQPPRKGYHQEDWDPIETGPKEKQPQLTDQKGKNMSQKIQNKSLPREEAIQRVTKEIPVETQEHQNDQAVNPQKEHHRIIAL